MNLEKKIRVGAVNYKNTKPLLYGIKRSPIMQQIALTEAYPAKLAQQLAENEIDVGLVPVAVLPKLPQYFIVSDYCIGAEQAVASVCLFSEVPLQQIQTVLLDFQSRTSVNLCKVLFKYYWKQAVTFVDATENFQTAIKGTTAAVVIGDKAFEQRLISPYIYDLAEAWISFTNLPFVFAAWVSNKPLAAEFIQFFNQANSLGLQHIDQVLAENPYDTYDLATYYTKNISYTLNANKLKGLDTFLYYLSLGL